VMEKPEEELLRYSRMKMLESVVHEIKGKCPVHIKLEMDANRRMWRI